jgi:hypothetical protein
MASHNPKKCIDQRQKLKFSLIIQQFAILVNNNITYIFLVIAAEVLYFGPKLCHVEKF